MKGKFTRVSASSFSQNIGIPPGWFVISYRWMPDKKLRRKYHGKWFKIKSENETIYRILRFSPRLKGGIENEEGEIVLDWPGWIDLWDRQEDVKKPLELEISEASWLIYPILIISHPDPTHRLAGELALLSVALGILSLILAIIALSK